MVFPPQGSRTVYHSYLDDIGEDGLGITVPQKHGQPLLLHYGDQVTVRAPFGTQYIEFTTKVVGETQSCIKLAMPSTWKQTQQRDNVRLPIVIKVECSIGDLDARTVKLHTIDLSAGGLCLRSTENIPAETEIWMTMFLEARKQKRIINAVGKVIRSTLMEHRYGIEYRCAIQYTKISRADQDFIVGFIFERTAKKRPKV